MSDKTEIIVVIKNTNDSFKRYHSTMKDFIKFVNWYSEENSYYYMNLYDKKTRKFIGRHYSEIFQN